MPTSAAIPGRRRQSSSLGHPFDNRDFHNGIRGAVLERFHSQYKVVEKVWTTTNSAVVAFPVSWIAETVV